MTNLYDLTVTSYMNVYGKIQIHKYENKLLTNTENLKPTYLLYLYLFKYESI